MTSTPQLICCGKLIEKVEEAVSNNGDAAYAYKCPHCNAEWWLERYF